MWLSPEMLGARQNLRARLHAGFCHREGHEAGDEPDALRPLHRAQDGAQLDLFRKPVIVDRLMALIATKCRTPIISFVGRALLLVADMAKHNAGRIEAANTRNGEGAAL